MRGRDGFRQLLVRRSAGVGGAWGAGAIVVVAATALVATAALLRADAPPAPAPSERGPLSSIRAIGSGEVVVGPRAVWTTTLDRAGERALLRIDPATERVTARTPLGRAPADVAPAGFIAVGAGAVWVAGGEANNAVLKVDAETARIEARIPLGQANGFDMPSDVAVGFGSLWATNHRSGSVARIDPRTHEILATIGVGPEGRGGPQTLAIGPRSVWVTVPNGFRIVRIDPRRNRVEAAIDLDFEQACGFMTVTPAAAWVPQLCGGRLVRIDPRSNRIAARLRISPDPLALPGGATSGFGAVWARDVEGGRLVRIDRRTHRIAGTRIVPRPPRARRPWLGTASIAAGFGSLWLRDDGVVLRVKPRLRG